jgi:uncharacterized membrane protein YgcG
MTKKACIVCGTGLGRWYVPHCFACGEVKCVSCVCVCTGTGLGAAAVYDPPVDYGGAVASAVEAVIDWGTSGDAGTSSGDTSGGTDWGGGGDSGGGGSSGDY